MAQVKFYKYNTTTSLQENKSNIEEGSIVFDNEAKILYLVTKANTLEPYYGTDTKYSFSFQIDKGGSLCIHFNHIR